MNTNAERLNTPWLRRLLGDGPNPSTDCLDFSGLPLVAGKEYTFAVVDSDLLAVPLPASTVTKVSMFSRCFRDVVCPDTGWMQCGMP
jgi:hypothetical protein